MSKQHVLSDMGDVCLTSQHHVNDRWRSPITLRLLVGSCGEDDFFFWSWRHGTSGRHFTKSDHMHSCCNQHLHAFTIGTTGIIGWWTSFHLSILDGISSKGRHAMSRAPYLG